VTTSRWMPSCCRSRTRTSLVVWPDQSSPPDPSQHPDAASDVAGLTAAAVAGANDLVRPDDEVLTVVTGHGVPRDVVEALCEAATRIAPDIEVIELEGGQVSPAFALGVE